MNSYSAKEIEYNDRIKMQKEFQKKKMMVLKKIADLKSQNKNVEEIYKFTNEIILEEDDEDTHRSFEITPR